MVYRGDDDNDNDTTASPAVAKALREARTINKLQRQARPLLAALFLIGALLATTWVTDWLVFAFVLLPVALLTVLLLRAALICWLDWRGDDVSSFVLVGLLLARPLKEHKVREFIEEREEYMALTGAEALAQWRRRVRRLLRFVAL